MSAVFCLGIALFYAMVTSCGEFLYPVASYTDPEQQTKLLVLYQKTDKHTELWSWDPVTRVAAKMLPSSFSPAAVALLPEDKGFSFIDNGRIRIKEFAKRSARSIETPPGVSNIGPISWYRNGVGYFHALERRAYAIFSITPHGDIGPCARQANSDCMYPACVDTTLFYIERTHQTNYHYCIIEQTDTNKKICVDFDQRPIIFLTMIDNDQGFVIEHPPQRDTTVSTITFLYHQLVRDSSLATWRTNYLFSFSIPYDLLDTTRDTSLYESIMPLLPRLCGSIIYYVDHTTCSTMQLCAYNLDTHTSAASACVNNDCCLVPVCSGSLLFCGGRVQHDQLQHDQHQMPYLYTDANNELCFSFYSGSNNIFT